MGGVDGQGIAADADSEGNQGFPVLCGIPIISGLPPAISLADPRLGLRVLPSTFCFSILEFLIFFI